MSDDEKEIVVAGNVGGLAGITLMTLLLWSMGVLSETIPHLLAGWFLGTVVVNVIMLISLRK